MRARRFSTAYRRNQGAQRIEFPQSENQNKDAVPITAQDAVISLFEG
jgi:hypothetical protein